MPSATPEEVWALLREVQRQFAETAQRFQETDRKFQETDRRFKETEAMFQETDRKFQETDRRFKETEAMFQETDRKFQETDRRFQETDRRFAKTERLIQELGKQIGGLGDKFGYFTEGLAYPALERILIERFGMETINPRVRVRRGGREREYDTLSWANGALNRVMVVEVKSRVKREAIDQLIGQVEELFDLIPELAGKERLGLLVGIDWDPGVEEEAQAQGLYTARIRDDVLELTTPEDFKPRVW